MEGCGRTVPVWQRFDYANGTLRITGPKSPAFDFSRRTRSAEVSIQLPSGSQVSAELQLGDVRCTGRLGQCRVTTAAGNAWLGLTGPLRVDTAAGHVTVDGVTGDVRVRAANGDIRVERAGAGVDAKTSNGSIRLGEVARGSVVLGTATGNLDVGIAAGIAAWLEVKTDFGKVHNLLETATRPDDADETVEVRGRVSYGDITIHRS
ncbi:DUF4097 family beta strand repeat-containing protein [Solwaraspora sp. WMMB335]|uniref:DUF4097 family beta strand repeat-containing protein n=1 Tax=Solwaraspora sp. WMMB335 TaxID=3404118 RepID=UPI003B92E411